MFPKVGIVGCGRIAERHAAILKSMQVNGELEILWVADICESRAKKFQDRFSVPAKSLEWARQDDTADWVVVCTPSGSHCEVARKFIRSGRLLVIEKPIDVSSAAAEFFLNLCESQNCMVVTVKQNRFNKPVVKARELWVRGVFGRPTLGTVRVRWCRDDSYYQQDAWRGTKRWDGGVLMNQAIHHIDLLQWFFGSVKHIHAFGGCFGSHIECEDTAVCCLLFESGALGVIEATTAVRPTNAEGSLSLIAENGSVVIGGIAVNEVEQVSSSDTRIKDLIHESEYPDGIYGFGHDRFYRKLIESWRHGDFSGVVVGVEALSSLRLVERVYDLLRGSN